MKPKVLQLSMCGPLYGAERWILALLRELDPAKGEHHVAVVADEPGMPTPLLDEAEKLGVICHRIDAPGRLSRDAPRQLRQLIVDHGINIVQPHGYKVDLITLLAVRGTSARTLATPHGWSHDAGWKLRGYEALDRLSFRYFDAVAPLSAGLHDDLAARKGLSAKLHLIPNGVDLAEVDQPTEMPPLLAELREKGPVIGYVGQLIARKDIETLLRAFAQLERKDTQLVLVGEGDARQDLAGLAQALGIADRTHFTGYRKDRLAWMRGFDLFVLPSLVEGMPRCLMEAMALKLSVVASDIEGSRDLVKHGKTGLLFPTGDVVALAAMIQAGLGKNDHGLQARKLIEEQQSAAIMAARYEALYVRLLGLNDQR
jgi:glycosyltransferase involved in cell wall biosynthesis